MDAINRNNEILAIKPFFDVGWRGLYRAFGKSQEEGMKLKSTMKKYIIAGAIGLIVIAVFVVGFIFAVGNRGQDTVAEIDAGQNSDGAAADGAAAGEGQGAAGQEPAGTSGGTSGGASGSTSGDGQGVAGQNPADPTNPANPADQANDEHPGVTRINVYSTDRDLDRIIKLYADKHWDFDYTVNFYTDASLYSSVDIVSMASEALNSGDGSKLDMYCLPAAYGPQYIKGEYSNFACTYKELGIDVDAALRKAEIPQCLIEDGSNPDGELIALPYLAETTLFMYRRSVAKEVFGTDDPDRIAAIIGAGTQKWDKFIEAAKKLRKSGYYIVPGFRDLEYLLDSSPAFITGPVESFEADPEWVKFMDVSKYLLDNDYIKYTKPWFDEWRDDLNGKNDKVFGFVTYTDVFQFMGIEETAGDWAVCIPPFNTRIPYGTGILVSKNSPNKDLLGPLVEWITLDSSDSGYQYSLANGESGFVYNDAKMSVSSGAVMKKVDGSRSILGGQNINPLVYDALKGSKGLHRYIYNELNIYGGWIDKIQALIDGETDRDTAIADYVSQIRESGKVKQVWDPSLDERVFFKDKGVELAVRSQLGMPVSDFYNSYLLNVTELDLSGKDIKSLEDIVHFRDLTKLYCSDNQITDISYLKGLKKLRKLDLSGNMISDISGLGDLADLRELDLSNNKIRDISSLAKLQRLEDLNLASNKISDISSLKKLTSLENVDLAGNNINDKSPVDHVGNVHWN